MRKLIPYPNLHARKNKTYDTVSGATVRALPDDIIHHYSGLRLGRKTVNWTGREWLKPLLTDNSKTIAVLKSRQVGWTVILAALISYYALTIPGIEMIYCTMRQEAMRYFSKSRLKPFFKDQGIAINTGDDRIRSFQLTNDSQIILISGHDDFAQARGYSPDMVFLDECEALPLQSLTVIQEAMAASDIGRMYLGGTGGMEGSVWEKYWNATTKQEWTDGSWQPQNQNGTITGYHITQRMLPDWTQESEDTKRNDPGSTPAKFDMEVLGIFTAGLTTPLPPSVVRKCLIDTSWSKPDGQPCIAAIDLAGGGESDTVIIIASPDLTRVMYAESIRDARVAQIFPKIKDVLDRYNPTDIVTDAGGNHELRYAIADNYECMHYDMSKAKVEISYKPNESIWPISKSFFVQKIISRFHAQNIQIPNVEPWILDHLTSETVETIDERNGGSYLRYSHMPGRKDDLLMALAFAEALVYSKQDANNPNNRKTVWSGGTTKTDINTDI